MRTSAHVRTTLGVLVIVGVLIVALITQLGDSPPPPGTATESEPSPRSHRSADTPEALASPRQRADLMPCSPGPDDLAGSDGSDDSGPHSLRGIFVECAGDGSIVEVSRLVAHKPVLLNLWAYWCGPCADELPALAEYQRRHSADITVITVHQDENETAGLLRLAELGVHLPTVQDGRRSIAAALAVPNVMPATVVLRPNGSVATIFVQAFSSADDIAAAVAHAR